LNDAYSQQAHEQWLKLSFALPNELGEYVVWCLAQGEGFNSRVEEAFDRLLDTGNGNAIRNCLLKMVTKGDTDLPARIAQSARALAIYSKVTQVLGPYALSVYEPEKLRPIWDAVRHGIPTHSVDMFIALIRVLKPRFAASARELATRFEAEALCSAHRFDEAAEIAQQYPNLLIGPEIKPIKTFIESRKSLGEPRSQPSNEADYQRIVSACFLPK
jgi:hypothetical protein